MKRKAAQLALLKSVESRSFPAARRKAMQQEIYQHLLLNSSHIRSGNFNTLSAADLGLLFQVTDELFFCGEIGRHLESTFRKPLTFRLSTRMTTAGGTTSMTQDANCQATEFEITVATTPLYSTFRHESHARVGGVKCHDRLQALQRIMEHEIVHLVELLATDDSNCQGRWFRQMVKRYFGHLESNHQLMTPREVARKQLGIRCGDNVVFRIDGAEYQGVVNRITKRATILVPDAEGIRYCDGQSYSKYYVPLRMLRRA